jgi:membrane associated rhomboid family serine protease
MTRMPSWFPLYGHSIAAEDNRRPPRAVIALIGAMAAVHVVTWVLPPAAHRDLLITLGAYLFAQENVLLPLRAYSLFTSWMVHDGIFHLLFNVIWIVAVGTAISRYLGSIGFIVFFLLTSAIGTLAGLAAHWGQPAILIGASGGAYGLVGAGAYVLTQGVTVARKIRAMVAFIAIFSALNIGFAMMGGESFGVEGAISWQAHFGGMAAGLLLYPLIAALRARRPRRA